MTHPTKIYTTDGWVDLGIQSPGTPLNVDSWHVVGAGGEPAFQNSWVAGASVPNRLAFRKDPFGNVWIKGNVSTGTTATTVFTLPVGYRPPRAMYFDVLLSAGVAGGSVLVNTDGTVVVTRGSAVEAHIDLVFDTETITTVLVGATGPTGPAFTTAEEGTPDFSVTAIDYTIPNGSWGTPGWFVPITVGPNQTWEIDGTVNLRCITSVHQIAMRFGIRDSIGAALGASYGIVQNYNVWTPAVITVQTGLVMPHTRIKTDGTVPAGTTIRIVQEYNGSGANGRVLRDGNQYKTFAWRRV